MDIKEHISEMGAQLPSLSIQSMVSDEEPHEEKPPADDQGPQYDLSGGFHQVLGCEQAKAALFENIILPLKCSSESHNTIFQGKTAV
jgi:hypothetical protein